MISDVDPQSGDLPRVLLDVPVGLVGALRSVVDPNTNPHPLLALQVRTPALTVVPCCDHAGVLAPVANTAAIAAQHNPHFMAKSPVCRRDHDLLSGHPP